MPETGRAAVFVGKKQPFDIREFPVPDPKDRDLVVRVNRANVCGSDMHLWRGDTDLARMGITYGMILGHEMTGEVARLGENMHTDSLGRPLKEGDRVVFTYYYSCGHCRSCLRGKPHACMMSMTGPIRPCDEPPHFVGGFAEYYYVKARQSVFKLPDRVTDEMAAGANCALSQVIHGFDEVGLTLGDTVVVQGAGGLGLFACAVAREMGARTVIAIDGVPERLELARAFGAHEVIDLNEVADPRQRVSQVQSLTEGEGADVVVELVGTPDVVNEGIRMLARCGRYLEIGNINPRQTYKADPSLLVGFNRSIHGVSLYPPAALGRAVEFLTRDYPFETLASHSFPLEEIDAAFTGADGGSVTRAAIIP